MKFFNLDGPFQHYGTIVFDIIGISILWLLITGFSFGLLMGPATIAMNKALYESIIEESGYTFKIFFTTLFKPFFYKFFISLVFGIFFVINTLNIFFTLTGKTAFSWLFPLYFFIMLELLLMGSVLFHLIAYNTDLGFKNLVKVCFIVAHKHLPTTFMLAFMHAGFLISFLIINLGYVYYTFILFFLPGLVSLAGGQLLSKKILKNYAFFKDMTIFEN